MRGSGLCSGERGEKGAAGRRRPRRQPTDPLLGAAQDEEGLDAVLLEVGVALAPAAWLHLVVPVQVAECGLGDVDASNRRGTENANSELQLPGKTKLNRDRNPGPQTWAQMCTPSLRRLPSYSQGGACRLFPSHAPPPSRAVLSGCPAQNRPLTAAQQPARLLQTMGLRPTPGLRSSPRP